MKKQKQDKLSLFAPLVLFSAQIFFGTLVFPTLSYADNPYQIGPEWGKTEINIENRYEFLPSVQRAATVTALVNGATGFYLGKFNGTHLIATNHHVCPMGFNCLGSSATFPLLASHGTLKKWVATFSEIDLTLLELEITDPALEKTLEINAQNFAFSEPIRHGQELASIGFGRQNNPNVQMTVAQDDDCKVYSEDQDFKKISDPDTRNPSDYQAWSFAAGCDASHGDSGSSMIDRRSGNLLGILWTGRIPKHSQIQFRDFLDALFHLPSAETWTELTYAVPALKIKEVLLANLDSPKLSADAKKTIEALIK